MSNNTVNNINVESRQDATMSAREGDLMDENIDLNSDIEDWEASVDAAGPFADVEHMRELLASAPKGAPSFNLLKDMVSIKSRKQG